MDALCKCGQPSTTTHVCDIMPVPTVTVPTVVFGVTNLYPHHDDRFCLLCQDGWTYEPMLGRHRP